MLAGGSNRPRANRHRLDIAYKPQYIEIDQPMRVDAFLSSITDDFGTSYWKTEVANPLQLNRIMERNSTICRAGSASASLSRPPFGGRRPVRDGRTVGPPRRRTARQATSAIRRYAENHDATAMVIDHDIYMIDLLADRLIVFDGEPAERSRAERRRKCAPG